MLVKNAYFHLWHFAFGLVLGHSNFNNTLFQWFFGVFWDTLCNSLVHYIYPLLIVLLTVSHSRLLLVTTLDFVSKNISDINLSDNRIINS